jgi:hypothetical protein
MESEDAQFRGDLKEATARARDFKKTIEDRDREVKELERAGYGEAAKRVEADRARDEIRRDFIRERNNQPSQELAHDRLEHEDDLEKEKEQKQMEEYRKEYVRKRDSVRAVIEHDAHIDENLEYGL